MLSAATPLAIYDFSGNANDTSGNSNHGTVIGATLATDRFGASNSAYDFDGTNDIIDLVNNASGADLDLSPPFSISAWIYPRATDGTIVGKRDTNSLQYQFYIGGGPPAAMTHRDVDGSAWGTGGSVSSSVITLNQWQFVALVVDASGNPTFYRNGTSYAGSQTGGTYTYRNHRVSIGARWQSYPGTGFRFNGLIDDVRFFSGALTSSEITAIRNLTAITVINVTSANADATYGVGDTITIEVELSESFTVKNTATPPTLQLDSGGLATYTGTGAGNTLQFSYTVASGHDSDDLNFSNTAALSLGSATIISGSGAVFDGTLPATSASSSLASNKNIIIKGEFSDSLALVKLQPTLVKAQSGSLKITGIPSSFTLQVFSITGKKLFEKTVSTRVAVYSYDLVTTSGQVLGSGIYLMRLVDSTSRSQKTIKFAIVR